jgi:hypothetical protein
MRRRYGILAWLALTTGILVGCGADNTGLNTGPATDPRSAQEKESDNILEKSRADYNKKVGK